MSSDLYKRNAEAMLQELKTVRANLDKNYKQVVQQNAKIQSLTLEVQNLKKMVIMMSIERSPKG